MTPILTRADLANLPAHEIGQYLHDLDDEKVLSAPVWVDGKVVGKIIGGPAPKPRYGRIARGNLDNGWS